MRADVLLLALIATALSGCASKESHPPELVRAPEDAIPVTCGELRDAGESLGATIPGPVVIAGSPATCLVDGLACALVDLDGGVCDGGADAASPVADCQNGAWIGRCQDIATDAGP